MALLLDPIYPAVFFFIPICNPAIPHPGVDLQKGQLHMPISYSFYVIPPNWNANGIPPRNRLLHRKKRTSCWVASGHRVIGVLTLWARPGFVIRARPAASPQTPCQGAQQPPVHRQGRPRDQTELFTCVQCTVCPSHLDEAFF